MTPVKEIIQILNAGGVVIMPAGTVYGLFCRADDPKAVKRIYKIKGRDFNKPLQVFLPDVRSVSRYAETEDKRIKKYLPGAYTLVLKLKHAFHRKIFFLKAGAIGVRVIRSGILTPVLKKTGPLAATSANFSGAKTPVRFGDIPLKLRSAVEMSIICDKMVKGRASTVVDLTGKKPFIIRK
jgi:L-threonylcarbamoyladenylate synthase